MTLTRRMILGAAGAATYASQAVAQDNAAARIQALLTSENFSGAALALKRGHAIHRAGYGEANREHGLANAPETRFLIASITKTLPLARC